MTGATVILMDEDAIFSRVVSGAMEAAGYDVECVETEEQARITAADFGCSVMVFSLERRDGAAVSLLKRLARTMPETEFIVLAQPASTPELVELYDIPNLYNHRWLPLEEIGDLARDVARAMERRALKRQNAYLLSELRDTRDELRHQAEFLIQVERMAVVGQIAAGFSHVLESATDEIVSHVGALRRVLGTPSHPAREKAAAIAHTLEDSLEPCRRLIVRMDRFCSGDRQLHEPTDLQFVLENSLALLHPTFQENSVTLMCDIEPDLPLLPANPDSLQQAFMHLAMNALQAMPDGGLFYVSAREVDGVIYLSLRDTGEGIAKEELARIFEPFYTTRPLGQGTGLGLSIARAILLDHDANLHFESAVGRGTTVSIAFRGEIALPTPMERPATVMQLAA